MSKIISLNEDSEKQQHACREGIKYFKNYTIKHFADEEAYMLSIGYSGYEMHKRLHDTMRDITLPALEAEMETHDYSVDSVQHFLGICVGWLNAHIMIEDHAITEYYSGEDFASGRALCYRLAFRTADKKAIQIYLLYEEKMVLNMIGEMLGHQIPRIDRTVAEAMAMLSQQFMSCISTHFSLTENPRPVKTDLLTFSQLTKLLTTDKRYPLYSLLFNTDKNDYFAFCVKK